MNTTTTQALTPGQALWKTLYPHLDLKQSSDTTKQKAEEAAQAAINTHNAALGEGPTDEEIDTAINEDMLIGDDNVNIRALFASHTQAALAKQAAEIEAWKKLCRAESVFGPEVSQEVRNEVETPEYLDGLLFGAAKKLETLQRERDEAVKALTETEATVRAWIENYTKQLNEANSLRQQLEQVIEYHDSCSIEEEPEWDNPIPAIKASLQKPAPSPAAVEKPMPGTRRECDEGADPVERLNEHISIAEPAPDFESRIDHSFTEEDAQAAFEKGLKQMPKPVSDAQTPLTDAAAFSPEGNINDILVPADFARTLERETIALKVERDAALKALEIHEGKKAPVQGYAPGIPWDMHMEAYAAYCKKYGEQKAMIEGWCRGGFGTSELDMFIPGWRDELKRRQEQSRDTLAKLKGVIALILCLCLTACEGPTIGGAGQLIGGLIAYPFGVAKSIHETNQAQQHYDQLPDQAHRHP